MRNGKKKEDMFWRSFPGDQNVQFIGEKTPIPWRKRSDMLLLKSWGFSP